MKKLLVIPAIMLSFCMGYTVIFATSEDTNLHSQIEQRTITNEDVAFFGSTTYNFNYFNGDNLSVLVQNTGDSPFSYTLYNAKSAWMIDGTLKPGEQAISEFDIHWTDWLPDGEYKIIFRNRDGALSKVHVATKLLE
ncbi:MULTISPECIES: hypothetical protein [Bacillus cereus group]|uniref:hypothetical protein n=1 Tax=Bacillus cereus group TaxID=86661 RepID=UPI0008FEAA6E|nr:MULTISPECIES: hypothetical protein [Bacillus cereus group]MDG1622490.1 hypothetical protein [Bacillus mobilis]MDX5836092.1 hypothetical protein [Bacillus cereus group sp. BfR-BA-01700]MED4384729.1 hypothetical protein [Bacillus mobilis]OJE37220.1 hypothetical protein BAQ44_16785 [Bacillus mobilis]HDR7244307.1 hypothetical protein [Bacillus mobilis]